MRKMTPMEWVWILLAFASWSFSLGLIITDDITPFSNLWLIVGVGYFMVGALE